jgi:hypothetical protein
MAQLARFAEIEMTMATTAARAETIAAPVLQVAESS